MEAGTRDEEAGLPATARVQRSRSSVPTLLFLSFMLFMLTSHNGDEFLARHQYQEALQSLTYQLSNYSAWMNGTVSNFTLPPADLSLPPLLEAFHVKGRPLDPNQESYYSNITGFIHGDAEYTNISLSSLSLNNTLSWRPLAQNFMAGANTTNMTEKLGSWHWNTSTKAALSVVEKRPPEAEKLSSPDSMALVHGRIELTDISTSDNLRLEFEGIHFVSNGTIVGFAEPPGRRIDIRLLPSLVPEELRNETAQIIEPELRARIDKLKGLIDDGVIDSDSSSNDEGAKVSCQFTLHAQIHPVPVPDYLMQALENELQNPTGITTVPAPKLSISALLVSKECGIMYEMKNTEGLRSRMFFRKVTTYAGLTAVAYLLILILSARQTDRSRTPSGISRVSRWTFLTQATMDSVSFAGHITFAILAEGRPSLSLIAPAFLACILFIHEAQFAALVHQIQGPEDYVPPATSPENLDRVENQERNDTQEPLLPVVSPSATATPPSDNSTPIATNPAATQPNTNGPVPTSFYSFFIHQLRTDPQAKLWLSMVIFLTFIVRVILSPLLSMLFVAVTYSSVWLPQIIRSVRRGRTSGLSKEYVFGTTLCRLYMTLYFLACPKNVLEIEPRPWVWALAVFVALQAVLVILQDIFGPSFFLPAKLAYTIPYDYHPLIPLPDPEAPEQSLGDCSICMDAIKVESPLRRHSKSFEKHEDWMERPSSSSARKGRGVGSVFSAVQIGVGTTGARKNYSLAPCQHLFHTDCLEKVSSRKYLSTVQEASTSSLSLSNLSTISIAV
ncbi:hypothetical protein CVT26_008069 [Gymnopilus dilepis]|uniref:RING-type E3 ubiquitin transferase n=1 Tax=Gymnopilus dilepis TaxID=231916 RepID=A0A409YJM2_9AGAR|nr:hypothetical protein CVT26_008069 [Gymnopilus dilepis]